MDDLVHAALTQYLQAHPRLILTLLIVIPLTVIGARLLAAKIPIPPANAPKWERALHFLLINWPSWGTALEGEVKSLIPGRAPPFLSVTVRPPVDSVEVAREVLKEKKTGNGNAGAIDVSILICIALITFVTALVMAGGGCSFDKGYVRALQIKGELSEGATIAHASWHTFDGFYHDNIVSEAKTFEIGMAKLRAWQQSDEKRADAALRAWRDALKTYREALMAAGAAQRSDWAALIIQTVSAAAEAIAVLADVGVAVDWHLPAIPEIPGLPTASSKLLLPPAFALRGAL